MISIKDDVLFPCVYDKANNNILQKVVLMDDINNLSTFGVICGGDSTNLYLSVEPTKLIGECEKKKEKLPFETVTPNDNPILVLCKFKD